MSIGVSKDGLLQLVSSESTVTGIISGEIGTPTQPGGWPQTEGSLSAGVLGFTSPPVSS